MNKEANRVFLFDIATDFNKEPNFRAFKKEELVELAYMLRSSYYSWKCQNKILMRDNEKLQAKVNQLETNIDDAMNVLKDAGCYDEETKTFCDDVWDELPYILEMLERGKE